MVGGKPLWRTETILQKEDSKMPKNKPAEEIPLIAFDTFKKSARKVLANTKSESDRQLAVFQASNARKRKAKKKR